MTSKAQELEWRAQDDARTMAQYQEIIADKNRMNRAIKAAQKEASRLEKGAHNMRQAASIKKKK